MIGFRFVSSAVVLDSAIGTCSKKRVRQRKNSSPDEAARSHHRTRVPRRAISQWPGARKRRETSRLILDAGLHLLKDLLQIFETGIVLAEYTMAQMFRRVRRQADTRQRCRARFGECLAVGMAIAEIDQPEAGFLGNERIDQNHGLIRMRR